MGKGSDALEKLMTQPPIERGPKVPKLELKPDAILDVDASTTIVQATAALSDGKRNVLLRSADGNQAVVVPLERYVKLVGIELATRPYRDAGPDGRLLPSGLGDSEVAQVDPNENWSQELVG